MVDGGEGAEEQVAGVSHDGGAARGDAALGLVEQEAGEEVVDGDGGLEVRETGGEEGGKILVSVTRRVRFLELGMPETEPGARVQDAETAAAAVHGVMAAT